MSSAFALNTDATLVLKDKNVSANDTGTCPALSFREKAPNRDEDGENLFNSILSASHSQPDEYVGGVHHLTHYGSHDTTNIQAIIQNSSVS